MEEFKPTPISKVFLLGILCSTLLFCAVSTKVPVRELLSPLWIGVILLISFGAAIHTYYYAHKNRSPAQPTQAGAAGNAAFAISRKKLLAISLITAAIVTAPRLVELFGS